MTIGVPYVYQGFGQNQEPLSYRVVENYKPKSHNAPDTYIQLLEYTMQHTPLRVIEQIILNISALYTYYDKFNQ